MRLYVAGSVLDRDRVRQIANILEGHGHTITFKWFDCTNDSPAERAVMDLKGVADADVLVVYMQYDRKYRGSWVEVGAALAYGKFVYFIGQANHDLVFRKHPLCKPFSKFSETAHTQIVREVGPFI